MTNGEKYKTAQERAEAFHKFYDLNRESHRGCGCVGCPLHVSCNDCSYCSENKPIGEAIAAHNRVAKAAKESEANK